MITLNDGLDKEGLPDLTDNLIVVNREGGYLGVLFLADILTNDPEDSDMFAPVLLSARRRALWLGINLLTAFLAAWVIG